MPNRSAKILERLEWLLKPRSQTTSRATKDSNFPCLVAGNGVGR